MAARKPPHDPARAVECDLGEMTRADLEVVDALAFAALTARRLGRRLALTGCSADLEGLIRLCGLEEVVGAADARLRLEARWQSEERKESVGVQEEVEPVDPVARHLDDLQ